MIVESKHFSFIVPRFCVLRKSRAALGTRNAVREKSLLAGRRKGGEPVIRIVAVIGEDLS